MPALLLPNNPPDVLSCRAGALPKSPPGAAGFAAFWFPNKPPELAPELRLVVEAGFCPKRPPVEDEAPKGDAAGAPVAGLDPNRNGFAVLFEAPNIML